MTDEVLVTELKGVGGNVGILILNRPEALNALTHTMCVMMLNQLRQWAQSDNIKAVVIRGAGGRAFSAGGDIKKLYYLGKSKELTQAYAFFTDEYRLNHLIHHYPKPFIAFLNGLTMGGGVGVSIHGSHRVVTESFNFAMPETGIGFFPDIGGSYFLSRCPGEIGTYLGLTGMRLDATEAIYAELADHFIFSNHLEECLEALCAARLGPNPHETVTSVLDIYSIMPETPALSVARHAVDHCFSFDTVEEIFNALESHKKPWYQATLAAIKQKSPTSLKVTLREIREGVALDFDSCMKMEFRLCQRFMQSFDFYEGVRALLIDKDRTPHWQPADIAAVSEATVNHFFSPLEKGDLRFTGSVS